MIKPKPKKEHWIRNFDIPFYEGILKKDPANVDVLRQLGHLYTKVGRIEEGLKTDRKLCVLCPDDPSAHYNLACSFSLLGKKRDGLRALRTAVDLGYNDLEQLLADPDLEALRKERAFKILVAALQNQGES